jgi:4'-phosphopantetheinyl transferase
MANSPPWKSASAARLLAEREVHVWRASLDVPSVVLRRLESSLNQDEKGRAEKFLVPKARERFVVARGILRELLATYLDIDPEKVELQYGPEGKPSLSSIHDSKICFSVSHSQMMGLFGFARDSEIGVDIEQVKLDFKGMGIASHFFSTEEVAALANLPPELATEAFFGCWTRKEAYVKALGQGLSIPLRSFTVNFAEYKQLLRDERGTAWSCCALDPAPGFVGAVVAQGESWNLGFWEWTVGTESLVRPNASA